MSETTSCPVSLPLSSAVIDDRFARHVAARIKTRFSRLSCSQVWVSDHVRQLDVSGRSMCSTCGHTGGAGEAI